MKKLLAVLLLCMSMFQTAYGLTIEVAPLKLKASVDAFGVHLGVDGRKAIVFTGEVAEDLAHMAGIGFKKSKQVIIVTGKEVNELLSKSVLEVGDTTKTVLIFTGDIMDEAIDLAKDAIRLGKNIVITTYKKGKTFGSYLGKKLYKMGKTPIIIFTKAGKQVINFSGKVLSLPLQLICSTFKLIKLPMACQGL